MDRWCWRRAILLSCCVSFFCAILPLPGVAQGAPSDMSVTEINVTPQSGAIQGDTLHIAAALGFVGDVPDAAISVEITWRRIDKQVPCGVIIETISDASAESRTGLVETWVDTSDLLPGTYEIAATVDHANWFPEADESNNRRTIIIELLPSRPELHPETIESTPSSPLLWGETASLSTLVKNTGRLASGSFHVEFQLFPIQCVDQEAGETWRISSSTAGTPSAPIGQWVFDSDADGAHPTESLADLAGALPEECWIPFDSVRIPGIERDHSVDVNGAFWTGEAMRELLRPSDVDSIAGSIMVPLSSQGMARLESCATTYAIRVIVQEPEGTAEQDPDNNRMVTALTVGPSALDLPELVPVEITFDEPLPLDWDNDMEADVVIMNQGGSAAPLTMGSEVIDVSFHYRRLGDSLWIPLGSDTITRLGIEQDTSTESVQMTIDAGPNGLGLEPGSYELRATVDEEDKIPEQNENNNTLVVGFSVQGTELHPIRLEMPSGAIAQGDTITVVAIVENTGDRSQSDFNVGFYVDDKRFDTFYYRAPIATEDGLEEDDRARVQGVLETADLPPETYTLRVVVDPDERVVELDEGNNEISTTLTVLPPVKRLAELHLTQIEFDPASPIASGEPLRIAATVHNGGRIGAERFQVEFYIRYSDDGGETWDVPTLSEPAEGPLPFYRAQDVNGLSRSAKQVVRETFDTIRWLEGDYQLIVRADSSVWAGFDAAGEVAELDETNNEMLVRFHIGPAAPGDRELDITPGTGAANLAVHELTISPAEVVEVGTPIQASASIANLGGEPVGPFTVNVLWISPTGVRYVIRSQIIGVLGAGEVFPVGPVTIDTALPMGLYQVAVSVDSANQIPEPNELDNELTRLVMVGGGQSILPDLVPIAVRFAPASGQVGIRDQLYAYVTVRNLGMLASGPFGVAFTTRDGTAYEAWGSLEPLQDTEIAYAWKPGVEGDGTLTITIDYADAVDEADEANNTASASYSVTLPGVAMARSVAQGDAAVTQLLADAATGTLYAAWASGRLAIINPDGSTQSLIEPEVGVTITSLRMVDGSQPAAYFGTSIGTVAKLDLTSGEILHEAFLMTEPIRALCPTAAGKLLAATNQRLVVLDAAFSIVAEVTTVGDVLHMGYDEIGDAFYVVTTTGLYTFDAALTPLCQSSSYIGTPTVLTVGTSGVFLGTDAGAVYAFSFCTSQGGSLFAILDSWRYPGAGLLGGPVVSIVVDPRDLDPVYITDGAGALHALSLTGDLLWTYAGSQHAPVALSSILTIEPRAGRILVGDLAGRPYVFDSEGELVFTVDSTASSGSAVVSNFAVTEARVQTEAGTRLVRSYYYGTQDGWIYRFDSQR